MKRRPMENPADYHKIIDAIVRAERIPAQSQQQRFSD
jgi:hypothetical protein